MPRFDDYLIEVQQRMGLAPRQLIRAWLPGEIAIVEAAIRQGIVASGFIGAIIPNFAGSNQSKGNKAADFFLNQVPQHLPANCQINAATGAGYPDRLFAVGQSGYCMELKATSNWQDGDSNRRVLTSNPNKMIRLIQQGDVMDPPAHLICTVLYNDGQALVERVRLDFLEPDSVINIRLEASTSQRLLAQGPHSQCVIV